MRTQDLIVLVNQIVRYFGRDNSVQGCRQSFAKHPEKRRSGDENHPLKLLVLPRLLQHVGYFAREDLCFMFAQTALASRAVMCH